MDQCSYIVFSGQASHSTPEEKRELCISVWKQRSLNHVCVRANMMSTVKETSLER